jgi:hypothetical protein
MTRAAILESIFPELLEIKIAPRCDIRDFSRQSMVIEWGRGAAMVGDQPAHDPTPSPAIVDVAPAASWRHPNETPALPESDSP